MTAEPVAAEPLLSVRGLSVGLRNRGTITPLVRDVDLDIYPGERVGIVGESGSGKSLTLLAIMGLLASPPLELLGGSVRFGGTELAGAPDRALRALRGKDIVMVYQDPMTSLDPVQRVGAQVAEGLRAHGMGRRDAEQRVLDALAEVRLPSPDRIARAYPHELSGGMRQRVMIAAALAGGPRLLLADEPTTALDVTIQREILRLVTRLQRARNLAVLWVTHDLGVAAQFAQRLAVMYAGRVVETGTTRAIFGAPQHPYTAALLSAVPSASATRTELGQIPGSPPDPARRPPGCSFAPRCRQAVERCHSEEPVLEERVNGSLAACLVPPGEWS